MIKDQCEKCMLFNNGCSLAFVNNGNSCAEYIRRGIDLEKHQVVSEEALDNIEETFVEQNDASSEQVYSAGMLKETTRIHGWLSFFLFTLFAGGLMSAIYPIVTYNSQDYDGSFMLAMTDILIGLMMLGLAGLSLHAFYQRRSDAVFLAKMYLVYVFAVNLFSLMNGLGDEIPSGIGSNTRLARSLIGGIVWFIYLTFSRQVKEVIPIRYRRTHSIDWYILVGIIVIPLLCMALGVREVLHSREASEATLIQEADISDNERTDGRVIFTIPDDYSCNSENYNGVTVFRIENSKSEITLCSDYDADESMKNIMEYWSSWESDEIKKYPSSLIDNEKRTINGNSVFYRAKRYDVDGTMLFWRFILIFEKQSSKICVLSSYDYEDDEYLMNLVNSIRFN